MKKKISYSDEPIGKLRIVKDFMPPPEELFFREDPVKVTMILSKSSVQFFKKTAKKYHAPYQKIIRSLLDTYVARYAA